MPVNLMQDRTPLDTLGLLMCAGAVCLGMGYGPLVGCCENGDELYGSIKGKEYFDWLSER
jgi:hypothetical protein